MNPRWLIRTTFTVDEPLHVGSGVVLTEDERVKRIDRDNREVHAEVKACACDAAPLPYIPGSTLKGALLSRFRRCPTDPALTARLFGTADQAGALVVFDAHIDEVAVGAMRDALAERFAGNELFSRERLTLIEPGVAIDRIHRAAARRKLFFEEVVPEKVEFQAEFVLERATCEDVAHFVAALHHPLRLGAESHTGRGKLEVGVPQVEVAGLEQVRAWLALPADMSGGVRSWQDACEEPDGEFSRRVAELKAQFAEARRPGLGVVLRFQAPFLVNDPGRVRKTEPKTADHRPRLDREGRPYLPARSFRGALRSQAERILRTLGHECCGPGTGLRCPPVKRLEDLRQLCPACRVFGATGWRSPLHVSAFHHYGDEPPQEPTIQDFVAIDRFHGGVSGEKKFDAERPDSACLRGRIEIEPERACSWGLGLLVLVLRDLIEGDIQFGWGRAKGFGACTARLEQDRDDLIANGAWLRTLAGPTRPGLKCDPADPDFQEAVKGQLRDLINLEPFRFTEPREAAHA